MYSATCMQILCKDLNDFQSASTDGCGAASVGVSIQWRVVLFTFLRRATVLLVSLRLGDLLGLWLVMVGPEAFALARCHHTDFVSPSVAIRTVQLDPLCPGVRRDAAVVRVAAPPPLATEDGVGQQMCGHTLAGTHQLPHWFGTAAGSIGDVTSGTQLPTAELGGTWGEERDITVTLMALSQNKHFEKPHTGVHRLTALLQLRLGLLYLLTYEL